jgi:hypothetical protein
MPEQFVSNDVWEKLVDFLKIVLLERRMVITDVVLNKDQEADTAELVIKLTTKPKGGGEV